LVLKFQLELEFQLVLESQLVLKFQLVLASQLVELEFQWELDCNDSCCMMCKLRSRKDSKAASNKRLNIRK